MTTVQDDTELALPEATIERMAAEAAEYLPDIPSAPPSVPAPTTEEIASSELQRIRDDNAYLVQQMREMSYAPSTPDLKPGDVIHHGDAEVPYPMVTHESAGPNKVFAYRTNTGEQITTTTNLLQGVLKKRFPMDHTTHPGERAFTTIDPGFRLAQGTIKCLLHKDDPSRPTYDAMGLPVCTKRNITSAYQRGLHMEKKHPTAWRTIESERLRRERDEDRQFQRALMGNVSTLLPEAPVEPIAIRRKGSPHICDCGRSFSTRSGLGNHYRSKHWKK